MFTIIRSGSEARFNVNGRVLRVRARCNGRERIVGQGIPWERAKWTVKLEFDGKDRRAASFKFYVGSGNTNWDKYLDFADFAESLASDCRAGSDCDNRRVFAREFGFTDMREAGRVFTACRDVVRKLNRVFSLRRGDFMGCAECRDWEGYDG